MQMGVQRRKAPRRGPGIITQRLRVRNQLQDDIPEHRTGNQLCTELKVIPACTESANELLAVLP